MVKFLKHFFGFIFEDHIDGNWKGTKIGAKLNVLLSIQFAIHNFFFFIIVELQHKGNKWIHLFIYV